MRRFAIVLFLLVSCAEVLSAQGAVERSPNMQGVWGLEPGNALFVLAHRFDKNGNQLMGIPTLTVGIGLPAGLVVGTDFTSASEVIPDDLTENEAQIWLKRPFAVGMAELAAMAGYNTAAASFDGAVGARIPIAAFRLYAEGRGFSDLFGSGDAGFAGAVGAGMRISEYLGITGDVGKVLSEDDVPAAWSASLGLQIPASPHTLSLVLTNSGATTLQGASRGKTVGEMDVRYGFIFTIPLGGRGRWGRIFDQELFGPPGTPD